MKKSPTDHLYTSPESLAQKAAQMPWKENARINLLPYEDSIIALRERGYSYAEVAEWLSKELNAPVKRGQVYYVCQVHAAANFEKFKEAEAAGEVRYLPTIDPEEAEKKALEQDQQVSISPRKTGGKK